VAKTHDLYQYIKLQHEVVSCNWDEGQSKWHVRIRKNNGAEFTDTADMLINGSGILKYATLQCREASHARSSNWAWPTIDGRESFKGDMIHSARWRKDVDFTGKRVAVVGIGATAVQIIPTLQPSGLIAPLKRS
jgi:cation diffusion facilitator CzcD-associated flavoprotein CzcO